MKKRRSVWVGLMAVCALSTGFASTGKEYRINMRVFEIPPWQSLVTNEAGGERGPIIGRSKGGVITASFPEGIVLIQTDLDKDAAENKIKEKLVERGYFKEAKCILPSGFGWRALGAYAFSCLQDELGVETSRKVYYQEQVSSPSIDRSGYWLIVTPKSVDEKEVVFGLKFECRLKTDESPEGAHHVLLDQDIEIPLGKMLLIGFSSKNLASEKTVYFLAAYIQKSES